MPNKKNALLIGINYINTSNQLNGCISDTSDVNNLLQQHKFNSIKIITDNTTTKPTKNNILNELMLFIGYLGETKRININKSTIIGFIPFLLYFNLIYENYAKHSKKGMVVFKYFISVWFLYGFASFMNYTNKNISIKIYHYL